MDAPPVQYVRTSDGYDIAYTVSGEGPAMVFIPGGQSHVQKVWQAAGSGPWLEALASRFRLVYFDPRGSGLSTRDLPPDFSMHDYERDLEAVVDRLELDGVLLSALAGAGHVAVRYAVKHAGRVAGLILHASSVDGGAWIPAFYEALWENDWEVFIRAHVRVLHEALTAEEEARTLDFQRHSTNIADFRARAQALRASNVEEDLPQLRTPTLLMHPRDYVEIRQEEATKLAAGIQDSRLVIYDGRFHLGNLDQGLEAIEDFVAGLSASQDRRMGATAVDRANLSNRETEVLRLLSAGKSNQQIADELVISLNTVNRHVSNIYSKTGAANRADATAYAFRHGIV